LQPAPLRGRTDGSYNKLRVFFTFIPPRLSRPHREPLNPLVCFHPKPMLRRSAMLVFFPPARQSQETGAFYEHGPKGPSR
jgi:hypothetical protein